MILKGVPVVLQVIIIIIVIIITTILGLRICWPSTRDALLILCIMCQMSLFLLGTWTCARGVRPPSRFDEDDDFDDDNDHEDDDDDDNEDE